jgi:hypothetical protein
MTHTCHAPHCTRAVPPHMYACSEHWYALPKVYRDAVWRVYVPGQERRKDPSPSYMAVQRAACAYLVFKPHDEIAAAEAGELLREAVVWQQLAIAQGAADPLKGLLP